MTQRQQQSNSSLPESHFTSLKYFVDMTEERKPKRVKLSSAELEQRNKMLQTLQETGEFDRYVPPFTGTGIDNNDTFGPSNADLCVSSDIID
jgi:hypothetical protein